MTDLVADIGGTNARVAFRSGGRIGTPHLRRTADFSGLTDLLKDVTAAAHIRPHRAALALAGPITGDTIKFTNLPWSFSAQELARDLGVEQLLLENDVAAVAWSVPHTPSTELAILRAGEPVRATKVVIAPGTGLGMSAVTPIGDDRWTVITSEGGHAYAASEVMGSVAPKIWHGPLTWEELLSGDGLLMIYRNTARHIRAKAPAEVTSLARAGDEDARGALEVYAKLLGACAGDMAMIFGARGGCYIAGGVMPALGELFPIHAFEEGFMSKGTFANYLKPIPVFLMTDPYAALRGLGSLLDQHAPA